MDFIDERLLHYCEQFTGNEDPLLKELSRETYIRVNNPRMLSGHLQGRFLSFISKMIRPSVILEIGTYTGYSALCLAEGLKPNGKLITIDPNEETNHFAQKYFNESPYGKQIRLITAEAQTCLPALGLTYDFVFIDADKRNYSLYYDLVIEDLAPGGIIIADNVLWSGKVLHENRDPDAQAIHEFNAKVHSDPRVECTLIPLRDGLMLIRKI